VSVHPQPHAHRLDDRTIAFACLDACKFLSSFYHTGTVEAANRPVRNSFMALMNDHLERHYELFEYLHHKGWYEVSAADQHKVSKFVHDYRGTVRAEPYAQAPAGMIPGAMPGVGPQYGRDQGRHVGAPEPYPTYGGPTFAAPGGREEREWRS